MTAGAAGCDDDLLEGEDRTVYGLKRVGENGVCLYVAADAFANRVRLFVDFAKHGIRKAARRRRARPGVFVGHQCPPPEPCAEVAPDSINGIVVVSMFQPAMVSSSGPDTSE